MPGFSPRWLSQPSARGNFSLQLAPRRAGPQTGLSLAARAWVKPPAAAQEEQEQGHRSGDPEETE